jgi:hypothetical protein
MVLLLSDGVACDYVVCVAYLAKELAEEPEADNANLERRGGGTGGGGCEGRGKLCGAVRA